jgi:hypothetical protein
MLDLNRIAKRLLNSDLPEVIRAIDLYELQAEGFLRKKSHRPFARKLCAMMLIDEGRSPSEPNETSFQFYAERQSNRFRVIHQQQRFFISTPG